MTLFKQSRTISNDITESDFKNPTPLQPVNSEQKGTSANDKRMCSISAEQQAENLNFALRFLLTIFGEDRK